LAHVTDIFGYVVAEYRAPEDVIIIGKSSNPANHQGSRILNFGVPCDIATLMPNAPNVDDL